MATSKPKKTSSAGAAKTVAKHREMQREQDSKDKAQAKKSERESKKAVQAGPRKQPAPPLPDQHLAKPGLEAASSRAWSRSSRVATPGSAER